jgi:hypothetical protein
MKVCQRTLLEYFIIETSFSWADARTLRHDYTLYTRIYTVLYLDFLHCFHITRIIRKQVKSRYNEVEGGMNIFRYIEISLNSDPKCLQNSRKMRKNHEKI